MRTETQLEQAVARLVKQKNCLWYKWVSPGNSGVPDRILIFPTGRIVFIELKDPKGVVSGIQKTQIAKLKKQGCDVRVIRTLGEVLDLIEEGENAGVI